jgi:hypothetical protein
MKFLTLRSLSAFCLAAVLAACGGPQDELPTQSAASIQTGSSTTSVSVSATGAGATTGTTDAASTTVPTASATMPQPDCAAEGCNAPRIIDGNAEAWRYAAMQRAAGEVSPS